PPSADTIHSSNRSPAPSHDSDNKSTANDTAAWRWKRRLCTDKSRGRTPPSDCSGRENRHRNLLRYRSLRARSARVETFSTSHWGTFHPCAARRRSTEFANANPSLDVDPALPECDRAFQAIQSRARVRGRQTPDRLC